MTRLDELARGIGACVLLITLLFASARPALAQEDDGEEEKLFRVERIELSGYGGWVGGETYLDLPAPLTELTNDTGARDILDFSGLVPDPRVEAPNKKLEPGWFAGLGTAFYLTPNFGITLEGTFGQAEVVFNGQRVLVEQDPENPDEEIEVRQPVSEIDRSRLRIWTGTAGIVYHILAERKHNTRPFVTLGIGGILNQFPDTDDVSALTWNLGLGLGFPVAGPIRGFVKAGLKFYVWETDEVALNQTMVLPEVSAGLVWRYMVPQESPATPPVEEEAAPGEDAPGPAPEGGNG